MQRETRQVDGVEDQVGAERHRLSEQRHRVGECVAGRTEIALVVELAVIRQKRLRYDAENPTITKQDGAVVQPGVDDERQADRHQRAQTLTRGDDGGEGVERGVDNRVLLDKIVDAVSGESHLGKHDERGTLGGRLPHQFDGGLRVGHRVGDTDDRDRARYSGKSVAIDGHRAKLSDRMTPSPQDLSRRTPREAS
ncbi:Uncharacterised protein [Mycobacteroides abscessus subsp. abscessus]|nr:Uncharacterised protein [Mycobacteroides abscessus subsp. abscessus]